MAPGLGNKRMQHLRALRVHSAEIEEGSTGKREGGSTGKKNEEEYVVSPAS